jgi:branched-chain amino acid transport system substrate-binding protein
MFATFDVRSRFLRFVALITIVLLGSGTSSIAADAPVEIHAILPLSGSGAFIGEKKVETLKMIEALVNATGGIKGRPVKFVVHDDGSSPQNGVQITSALLADHATVILGSVLAAICKAEAPLVSNSGPLTYCYSPNVDFDAGTYTFTASLGTPDTIVKMLQFFKQRGWTRIALIASTDASGEDFDQPFVAALTKGNTNGLTLVAHERFNIQDISASAQIARIKAAAPQVVMIQAVGPAFGTVLRNINDAGLNAALFGAAGDLSYKQLDEYKTFVHDLYFVTAGGATPVASAPPQQKRAQDVFFKQLKAAGIRPEYLYADTWDPPMLVVDALRHIGPDASANQLRDYIANLHAWWGVSGVYDFQAHPQRGLGASAAIVDHWDATTGEIGIVP